MTIVIDIETSGLYPEKNGIWQIGAVDVENPENLFIEEAYIDDEDEITEESLQVIGKTKEYLRNKEKQTQKQLLENFFNWVKKIEIKMPLCQNPQFDMGFMEFKARKYNLDNPFHHRSLDLHTIALLRYHDKNDQFKLKGDHSGMSLSKILEFCGMKDERKAHDALEDAKLTAECFSRMLSGKILFEEFSNFQMPEKLEVKNVA